MVRYKANLAVQELPLRFIVPFIWIAHPCLKQKIHYCFVWPVKQREFFFFLKRRESRKAFTLTLVARVKRSSLITRNNYCVENLFEELASEPRERERESLDRYFCWIFQRSLTKGKRSVQLTSLYQLVKISSFLYRKWYLHLLQYKLA